MQSHIIPSVANFSIQYFGGKCNFTDRLNCVFSSTHRDTGRKIQIFIEWNIYTLVLQVICFATLAFPLIAMWHFKFIVPGQEQILHVPNISTIKMQQNKISRLSFSMFVALAFLSIAMWYFHVLLCPSYKKIFYQVFKQSKCIKIKFQNFTWRIPRNSKIVEQR